MPSRTSLDVDLRARSDRLRRDLRSARFQFRRFSRDIGGELRKTTRAFRGIGRALGTALGTEITTALISAVRTAIQEFEQLNDELIKTRTLVGLTAQELGRFEFSVRDISRETGRSLLEVAEGLVFVTSARQRGAEAEATLTAASKAAALGLGTVRQNANFATSVMAAYGSETITASEALDALLAGVREGKLEPAALGASIGQLISPAKTLGVEIQELIGAISTLSLVGIDARRASTAILGIFATLIKPAEDTTQALAEFGLTIDDLREAVSGKGFLDALQALSDVFGGDIDAIGRVFPRVETLPSVFGLIGEQGDEAIAITRAVIDSAGDLDKEFEKLSASGALALKQLRREMEILRVSFGSAIGDEVQARAIDITATFRDLGRYIPTLASVTLSLTEAFIGFGKFILRHRELILNVIKVWIAWRAAMLAIVVGGVIQKMTVLLTALAVRIRAIGAAALLAQAKVVAGVAGVAAAILGISALLTGLIHGVQAAVPAVAAAFVALGENIRIALGNAFRWLQVQFEKVTNNLQILIEKVLIRIDQFRRQFALLSADSEGVTRFEASIAERLERIGKLEARVVDEFIGESFRSMSAELQRIPADFEAGFTGAFTGIGDQAKSAFESARSAAAEFFGFGAEPPALPLAELTEPDAASSTSPTAPFQFGGAAAGQAGGAGAAPRFDAGAETISRSLIDGVSDAIRGGGAAAVGMSLIEGLNSIVTTSAANVLRQGINGIFEAAFGDTLSGIIETGMSKLFSSAFDAVGSLFSGLLGAFGGGAAAPTAHGGGYVPGRRGAEVPIIAQAGELILTERQQQRLLGAGGAGVQVMMNVTGNVDAATQRALSRSSRELVHLLAAQEVEGVRVGG